jgi:hypothetical protein
MNRLFLRFLVLSLCASSIVACKKSTPTSPSGGGTTVTVTGVEQVSPAANASIPNSSQPVSLTVKNATVTGGAAPTYVFEVATDAAFANKIVTRTGISEGTSGQTVIALDALPAGDYYWRARAEAGGTPGPLSGGSKFTIGSAISLSAPTPLSPTDGSKAGRKPTFRVKNATRTGPAGTITYKFEVSTSSTFATITTSSTVSEGSSETTFTPASNLATGTKYFWRVTAMDAANNISSSASAVQNLTISDPSQAEQIAEARGITLWTGAQPSGTPSGRYGLGPGWEVRDRISYDGQPYASPPIEALRLVDLIDRGMDPDSAIDWLEDNGYPSTGQWYPGIDVIGIPHVYIALIGGSWELVHRVGG